jgi:RHS repeat-associated protein
MLVPNRHGSSTAYRYGFQGQEKDDELKGEGNSLNYTFRMHDPRVGRFFATDPLESKYPNISTYAFVANNVLNAIDADGRDIVYLNKNGQVTKVVSDGKPTIKIVEYGAKAKKDFASYDITRGLFNWNNEDRQIVANVAGYYAKDLGMKNSVEIGATYEESNSLAFTQERKNIFINPGLDGKINPLLNNKYNLISVLEHEKFHTEESKKGSYTYSKHSTVYIKQMKSENFHNTTEDFQKGTVGSLQKYITAAKENGEDYNLLIKEFNDTNTEHYKLRDRDSGGIQMFNSKGDEMIPELTPALTSPH